MVAFFERYDVLLAPTTQVLPFPVELEYPTEIGGVPQDNYLEWMRSCTLISATGCPALSVPGGFTADGLPVGLQVIGAPRADRRVLEVGHAFEQATGFWQRRPALCNPVYRSLARALDDRQTATRSAHVAGRQGLMATSVQISRGSGCGGAGRAGCGRRPAARPAPAGRPP